MKKLFFFFLLLIVVSCKTAENADSAKDSHIQRGIVHISNECGVIITIFDNNQEIMLFPVNLGDQYKKEGMMISFNSHPSRAVQPSGCIVDRVVSLDNVKKSR
jgi:hypothetical protein